MNVIQLWRIYRRAQKLAGFLEDARMSKSLWKSKIFWAQILSATCELTQVLPLPAGSATAIGAVATILLRLITDKPVHVLPQ